jgi:hypothetical protein
MKSDNVQAAGTSSGLGAQRASRRRLGCLAAGFAATACVGLVVSAAVILVSKYEAPPPPPPPTLTAAQLRGMKPMDGIWQDGRGAEIIFTDPGIVRGVPAGKVTFVNVPDIFSWQWGQGPPPSPSGQGHWTVTARTSQGGGIVFWFDGPPWAEYGETVAFEVRGSISNPVLVCQYPDGGHTCTYTRRP